MIMLAEESRSVEAFSPNQPVARLSVGAAWHFLLFFKKLDSDLSSAHL